MFLERLKFWDSCWYCNKLFWFRKRELIKVKVLDGEIEMHFCKGCAEIVYEIESHEKTRYSERAGQYIGEDGNDE